MPNPTDEPIPAAPEAASTPAPDATDASGEDDGILAELGFDLDEKPDESILGEPTATPEPPAPEPVAPETPEADPLAGATALDYTVNGEGKTADYIKVLKDVGAVIDEADLPKLRDQLQRAEWYEGQAKSLYADLQRIKQVGGVEKIAELNEQIASINAAGTQLLNLITDDNALLKLLAYDDAGNVVVDPHRKQELIERLQFAGERASFDARKSWQQQNVERTQTETQGATREQALGGIIGQIGQALPSLTRDDLEAGYAHFSQFADALFRPATPAEAQSLGIKAGDPVLDAPRMHSWFKDRAAMRDQLAVRRTTDATVAKENAARLAAVRAPKARPAAPAPTNGKKPTATPEKLFEGDDGTANSIFNAWRGGRFAVPDAGT